MDTIPYGRQKIEAEDIEAVVRVLKSDFLTQGPAVQEFETSVSSFLKSISGDPAEIYALAVSNGTAALHLACLALEVKKGDRVLVTSNSFAASANCVRYADGEVEFVDISLKDYCLDLAKLETHLAAHPAGTYKGVIAVDFAGIPLDLKKLREICDRYKIWLLEDAAHALGAQSLRPNEPAYAAADGRYADIAILSFHPVKHIAMGEGGMMTTRSKALYEKMKLLRTHGITKDPSRMARNDGGWFMEMQELGYNCRISDILCALGTSQMTRIRENLKTRRKIAARYDQELTGLPITLPEVSKDLLHAYHLYVIRTQVPGDRKKLYDYLAENKIYAQVHYIPIYQHPYYVERYGKQSFANCEAYYDSCLSIPMYHSMTDADQTRVIQTIRQFFKK
jgi:UDP-4-amino-4,6-dideoxy-N-acetyl-beta-L-altrosamine transaminase